MTSPLVSVVIPTRNRRDLLTMSLRSVLVQRDVALEVVVVDEASDDGTEAAVRASGDGRVRLLRNREPRGVAAARNQGIDAATGDWIALLDDDDLWAPTKLAAQLAALDDTGRSWSCTGAVAIDAAGTVVGSYRPLSATTLRTELRRRNPVPAGASNVVMSRAALPSVGAFDPALRHLADWDLWIRLAAHGAAAVVDSPLVAYRLHAGNATLDTAGMIEEARSIERRYRNPIDWAAMYRWAAWSALRGGQRRQAAKAYLRAARAGDPLSSVRAVNALLHPVAGRRIHYHPLPRRVAIADLQWRASAESWLVALRRDTGALNAGAPRG